MVEVADGKAAPPPKKREEWRLFKVMRLLAYVAAVAIVAGGIAARSAFGSAKDSALEIGSELGKLGDVGLDTPLMLNGQPIHVGSSMHQMSVSDTLDLAEKLCEKGADPLAGVYGLGAAADGDQSKISPTGEPGMGTVRQERDDRGVVLCFAPPEGREAPTGPKEKIERFIEFMKTGELQEMGDLRYLFATRTPEGATHLVRVWTDTSFNFFAMSRPLEGGDAPGSDPSDVPRPPESTRLMSATVETADYAVRVYQSKATAAEVAQSYDKQLKADGWELDISDGDSRAYSRNDITVFVTPTLHEGKVLVSLLHMGVDNDEAGL